MTSEKPLHVHVAEALGCKTREDLRGWICECADFSHSICRSGEWAPANFISRYDLDWAAAGPEVEKLLLRSSPFFLHSWERVVDPKPGKFQAYIGGDPIEGWGPTPLIAVCNLILALKEAGRF